MKYCLFMITIMLRSSKGRPVVLLMCFRAIFFGVGGCGCGINRLTLNESDRERERERERRGREGGRSGSKTENALLFHYSARQESAQCSNTVGPEFVYKPK